jgi:hypothetical protein
MIRSCRLLVLAAVSLWATAASTRADFNRLLAPVPGSQRKVPAEVQPAGPTPGQAPAPGAPLDPTARPQAPVLLTEGELVAGIEKDLPKRYSIQGDLRVTLARPWVPIQLNSPDFFAECIQLPPSGLASNMPVIVRGVSGGKIIGECLGAAQFLSDERLYKLYLV